VRLAISVFAVLFVHAASSVKFENGGVYQSQRHDRFLTATFPLAPVANPDFLLAGFESDLTGVGWQTDRPNRLVTLISPRHFLNSAHYRASGTVTFYNRRGELRTYSIADNQVLTGDIAIGTLRAAIPAADKISFLRATTDYHSLIARVVHYLGGTPTGAGVAAGRTGIASLSSLLVFDSRVVPDEDASDRVLGSAGDSGGPSFFVEGNRLVLVGHHYFESADFPLASPESRDVVDGYLAADGFLLDVVEEGRLGDPQHGGLVVARLPSDLTIRFESHVLRAAQIAPVRTYNFSQHDSIAELSISGDGFSLVDDSGLPGLTSHAVTMPAGGTAVDVIVAFSASAWGASSGLLTVQDASGRHEIVLEAQAFDVGVAAPDLVVSPFGERGFPPSALYPGDTATYEVQVVNRDDIVTATGSDFALSCDCPPSWKVDVSPMVLTLGPGSTGTATFSVSAAAGEFPGVFELTLEVADADESAHSVSATAIYEVLADSESPSPASDLMVAGNHKRHRLSWNSATDDTMVAGYEVLRDGQRIELTTSTSATDRNVRRDRTYLYTVRAYDAASNRSSDVELTVRNGQVVGETSDPNDDSPPPDPICIDKKQERGKRCFNGIDNDCDGLVDAADPNC